MVRHEERDAADVGAVLGQLEHARDRFDDRFGESPGEYSIITTWDEGPVREAP